MEGVEVIEQDGPEAVDTSLMSLLKARGNIGKPKIEAMTRFALGGGLLAGHSSRKKSFTHFGRLVRSRDPYLNDTATQWLMHYHLSAPHGPGPTFWNYLVSSRLRIGAELKKGEVAKKIAHHLEQVTGEFHSSDALGSSATAFLGTYANQDCLGLLGFLESSNGTTSGLYWVKEPDPPPLWAFAYALADYWESVWPEQPGINLAKLLEPGSFASIFLISSSQLEKMLEELRREGGVLDLYRDVPPYQVTRLWSDKAAFLERLYE